MISFTYYHMYVLITLLHLQYKAASKPLSVLITTRLEVLSLLLYNKLCAIVKITLYKEKQHDKP